MTNFRKIAYLYLILAVSFLEMVGNTDEVLCLGDVAHVKAKSANLNLDSPQKILIDENCGACFDLPLDSGQNFTSKKLRIKKFSSFTFTFFIPEVNNSILKQLSVSSYLANPPPNLNATLDSLKTVILLI